MQFDRALPVVPSAVGTEIMDSPAVQAAYAAQQAAERAVEAAPDPAAAEDTAEGAAALVRRAMQEAARPVLERWAEDVRRAQVEMEALTRRLAELRAFCGAAGRYTRAVRAATEPDPVQTIEGEVVDVLERVRQGAPGDRWPRGEVEAALLPILEVARRTRARVRVHLTRRRGDPWVNLVRVTTPDRLSPADRCALADHEAAMLRRSREMAKAAGRIAYSGSPGDRVPGAAGRTRRSA